MQNVTNVTNWNIEKDSQIPTSLIRCQDGRG